MCQFRHLLPLPYLWGLVYRSEANQNLLNQGSGELSHLPDKADHQTNELWCNLNSKSERCVPGRAEDGVTWTPSSINHMQIWWSAFEPPDGSGDEVHSHQEEQGITCLLGYSPLGIILSQLTNLNGCSGVHIRHASTQYGLSESVMKS